MKTIFIIIIIGLLLYGCRNKEIEKHLQKGESVRLEFYYNNDPDSVQKIVTTTDATAIKKLAGFIDSKERKNAGCGYEGQIIFSAAQAELQKVNFTMQENCRQFSFIYNGKVYATEMDNEAVSFLQALKMDQKYY